MAGDSNALGAPAEGFGQTVSFAFDPRGEVPQQQTVQRRAPNIGQHNEGVRATQFNPNAALQPVRPDPTVGLLMRAGQGILNEKLDEARNKEFVSGMQRAMEGEALADIKAEKPWWSQLFGDTPAVEGARAYTAQDRVNRALSDATARMPELAKLSPKQAQEYFTGLAKGAMTGDAAADTIILKTMVEQQPALMKAQAKAHYAYTQEEARRAMASSLESGGQALQEFGEMLADGKISRQDFDTRSKAYLYTAIPPAGINEENYGKTVAAGLRSMADRGQFHAVSALVDNGVLGALTAEQRGQVERAIEQGEQKLRNRYAFKYVDAIAEIQSDADRPADGQTPRELLQRAKDLNAKYQALTGSKLGIFNSDELAALGTKNLNAHKAEMERAAKAALVVSAREATANDKAAAAAVIQAGVDRAIATGNIDVANAIPGATKDQIDTSFYGMAKEDPQGGLKLAVLAYNKSGYKNPLLMNDLQEPLRMAVGRDTPTPEWAAALQQYQLLRGTDGGRATADAYYGDFAPRLEKALRMTQGNLSDPTKVAEVFQATMGVELPKAPAITAEERKKAVSDAADKASVYLPMLRGRVNPNDSSKEVIGNFVAQAMDDWRSTGMTKEEAATRAINTVLSSGQIELLGGYAIVNSQPGRATLGSLMEGQGPGYRRVPEETRDRLFSKFLEERKLFRGVGSVRVVRTEGDQFVIWGMDKDGQGVTRKFTAVELAAYAAEEATKPTALDAPAFSIRRDVTAEQIRRGFNQ